MGNVPNGSHSIVTVSEERYGILLSGIRLKTLLTQFRFPIGYLATMVLAEFPQKEATNGRRNVNRLLPVAD
jgi:hypothetical protein